MARKKFKVGNKPIADVLADLDEDTAPGAEPSIAPRKSASSKGAKSTEAARMPAEAQTAPVAHMSAQTPKKRASERPDADEAANGASSSPFSGAQAAEARLATRNDKRVPHEALSPETDGRSLRATGRHVQMNMRMKPETVVAIKWLASRYQEPMSAILERLVHTEFEREQEQGASKHG